VSCCANAAPAPYLLEVVNIEQFQSPPSA